MKKILSIAVVIVVLAIIGKIIMSKEISELEEDIVRQVTQGDYYTALQDANEIERLGEKMSKKIARLIEDIQLLEAAEIELGKYSQMNLGRVKAILDEMNGSYKKYDIFKYDVENLKDMVEKLEEYGNEGVELIKRVEKLIEEGEKEKAKKLLNNYMTDKRYQYMPKKLQDAVIDWLWEMNRGL